MEKSSADGAHPAQAPRNYLGDVPPLERVDQKPMTAKDFAKMKHVEFKKHLAIAGRRRRVDAPGVPPPRPAPEDDGFREAADDY